MGPFCFSPLQKLVSRGTGLGRKKASGLAEQGDERPRRKQRRGAVGISVHPGMYRSQLQNSLMQGSETSDVIFLFFLCWAILLPPAPLPKVFCCSPEKVAICVHRASGHRNLGSLLLQGSELMVLTAIVTPTSVCPALSQAVLSTFWSLPGCPQQY